jgi:hypothetical protein
VDELLLRRREIDSKNGTGAFSLQDNTNPFVGIDRHLDRVQFVYQTTNGGTSGIACVWQIDLTIPKFGGYNPTGCAGGTSPNVTTQRAVCCIEGFELPGLLGMVVAAPSDGTALAAVWPDLYGLMGWRTVTIGPRGVVRSSAKAAALKLCSTALPRSSSPWTHRAASATEDS